MRYDIYNHKKGVEGASPLNPESPVNETATSEKRKQKYKTMLRYGEMLAQRAYSTVTQELRAGGNEQLATALSNAGNVMTSVTMAIASSGASLIPEAINASAQLIQNSRNNARQNRIQRFQEELLGSKVNFNQGRIYYD